MPTIQTKRVVAHSPQSMFDLVADIERYPQFVPLCEGLKVRSRRQMEDGREMVTAAMTIGYKLFRETFTSRVILDRSALKIEVIYLDGPLKQLENTWCFLPEGDGKCSVDFYLSYELASQILARVMGAVFEKVFGRFAQAFEARADDIYRKTA